MLNKYANLKTSRICKMGLPFIMAPHPWIFSSQGEGNTTYFDFRSRKCSRILTTSLNYIRKNSTGRLLTSTPSYVYDHGYENVYDYVENERMASHPHLFSSQRRKESRSSFLKDCKRLEFRGVALLNKGILNPIFPKGEGRDEGIKAYTPRKRKVKDEGNRRLHHFIALCLSLVSIALLLWPNQSYAQDAGTSACVEQIPEGATKPILAERVAARTNAGALIDLEIAVQHGVGETATLPANLPAQFSQGDVRIVDEHNWGHGAPPKSTPDPANSGRATTLLKVPFVILSKALQRTKFTLPSLRVVVLRKSGGDISVCTQAHEIEIDQPIANTPDPEVRPNPPSVPQITRNERAVTIATYTALGIVAGAILAALVIAYLRRPKPTAPPPPPIDPWRVAINTITTAREDYMAMRIEQKLYYDQLSDALRLYIGRIFVFDGLELTTDEIIAKLRKLASPLVPTEAITKFLQECDLVKFAGQSPPYESSIETSHEAERIVRMLMAGGDTHWFKPPTTNEPTTIESPIQTPLLVVENPLHANNFVLQNTVPNNNLEASKPSVEPQLIESSTPQLNLFDDMQSTTSTLKDDSTQAGGKS